MNRGEFQRLAEVRLCEAKALLAAGLWDGAYYLAGYAVECGLKACVLARIERDGVLFDDGNRKFSEQCWTHDLTALVALAGLNTVVQSAPANDPDFALNWVVVKDWSEKVRYTLPSVTSQGRAERMLVALTSSTGGVYSWLSQRW